MVTATAASKTIANKISADIISPDRRAALSDNVRNVMSEVIPAFERILSAVPEQSYSTIVPTLCYLPRLSLLNTAKSYRRMHKSYKIFERDG